MVSSPGAEHLLSRPHLLEQLLEGYSNPSIALNCGAILRDAARDERVAELLLASSSSSSRGGGGGDGDGDGEEGAAQPPRSLFDRLLSAVDAANFEVASDAFASLRDLLTRHRRVVAARLDSAPDAIFGALASLTSSTNYVSRRQGVRLLGEILLERANARAMLRYVSDPDNLKAAMVLLKDPSRSIQFEAFHVFKVFVVNPNKLPPICAILASNREKLLARCWPTHFPVCSIFFVKRGKEREKEKQFVVSREGGEERRRRRRRRFFLNISDSNFRHRQIIVTYANSALVRVKIFPLPAVVSVSRFDFVFLVGAVWIGKEKRRERREGWRK